MIQIEKMSFAPKYIQDIAAEYVGKPRAYAMIRIYDADGEKFPALRDRSEDVKSMLRGLVGDLKAATVIRDFSGRELHEFGSENIIGAGFTHKFRLIFV